MKLKTSSDPTMCYHYPNEENEYVFAVKGRPFGCLVSPHIPTPTSTIIDYNLVRDIGVKMTDLRYQKFYFAGNKLRILGKVSMTVQTVQDGLASGSFHFKANVVLDLAKHMDTEAIAGVKLTSQLNCTSSGARDSPTSSPCSSPARSTSPSPSSPSSKTSPERSKSPPTSPPGFAAKPKYCDTVAKPDARKPPEIFVSLAKVYSTPFTPLTANLETFTEVFSYADFQPDTNSELRSLLDVDPNGKVSKDTQGRKIFITSSGYIYEFGHGRMRCCQERCLPRTRDDLPNNCAFNQQWLGLHPTQFKGCGPGCKGAFCQECMNY